jgi:DNA-binding MarR family transcriptional regulator
MEKSLLEFVNTLDLSLKKIQEDVGVAFGVSKLTINQFRYLDAVYELGDPTITEIAERLQITKASVTSGIHKLIQLGYVTKAQSDQDKRVFHVYLSESGERMIAAKYRAVQAYVAFIRRALTDQEARQFEETLNKLVRLFQQP